MGRKEDQGGGLALTPEQERFYQFGFSLGRVVEQRLHIPMAGMVHPEDLVKIGASVYAGDQLQILLRDPQAHTRYVAEGYTPVFYQANGITSQAFKERYPSLIGNGDYATGEIATALRTASDKLTPQDTEQLEREFAQLFASMLTAEPQLKTEIIPKPGVQLDTGNNLIRLGDRRTFGLDREPTVMMEYGPGIAGAKKIPDEVAEVPLSVYIENGPYINQMLVSLAGKYGLPQAGRFIGREDGIKEGGKAALQAGLAGKVDILTASMVHSAGETELTAGIDQGKALLRPGGLFVVQAPVEVNTGEMPGEDMFRASREAFGEPALLHQFRYVNQREGGSRNAYYAVFRKAA